jgi:hypothetical protein
MARIAAVAPPTDERQHGSSGGVWEEILRDIERDHQVERIRLDPAALQRVQEFPLCLYEVGPAWPAYGPVYELAVRHPGLVLLVTPAIRELVLSMAAEGRAPGIEAADEARLRLAADGSSGRGAEVWCARLIRLSLGVMVSSPAHETAVRALGYPTPVHHVGAESGPVAAEAVQRCLARTGDPVRRSVRRWAVALAQTGATVDLLERGHGVRYADVLEAIGGAST